MKNVHPTSASALAPHTNPAAAAADKLEAPATDAVRYCVDGYESEDVDSTLQGDGQFAPFWVFDITGQRNIAGPFTTRKEAEAIALKLNSHGALMKSLAQMTDWAARLGEVAKNCNVLDRTVALDGDLASARALLRRD